MGVHHPEPHPDDGLPLRADPLAIQLSFQETKGFGTPEWVGLDNYIKLVSDPVFWQSLANTIVFTIVTVPIVMAAGSGSQFC